MAADKEGARKKDRDPILTVGFVVLVLAFATVLGIFVNDHYIRDSSGAPASTGNTVEVDYTGSYYGIYDEDGSRVFDTSLFSIASNEGYAKSYEFNLKKESEYNKLSFTIGGTDSYLQAFKDSIIGKRPGETVRICIAPADGYGELTADQVDILTKVNTIPKSEYIDKKTFEKIYGFLPSGEVQGAENGSPYGWKYNATPVGSYILVSHIPTQDWTYTVNDNVSINVTAVSGSEIEFEYVMGLDYVEVDENDPRPTDGSDPTKFTYPDAGAKEYSMVKLIKMTVDNQEVYIMAVDAGNDGSVTEYVYKKTADSTGKAINETVGMYLYFSITLVGYR